MLNFFKNNVQTIVTTTDNVGSTIIINGVKYSGNNINMLNNKVVIDGINVTPDAKNITISVEGNISTLSVDMCNKINITGNIGSLSTVSGDVEITGEVGGNVGTVSGDVKCGNISGSVKTVSGDIKNKK